MKSKQGNGNFVYLIVVAAVLFLVYSYLAGGSNSPTVSLNQIADDIDAGKIDTITVRGDLLQVVYKQKTSDGAGTSDQPVISRKGRESSLIEQLQAMGVNEEMLR